MKKKQEGSSSDAEKSKQNGIEYEKSELVSEEKLPGKPMVSL